MKNRKLLLFCIAIASLSFVFPNAALCQQYQIGHTTINFIDASRNNRSIATEVYYPANSAGNNVPVSNATTEKFPPIVFGHGFVMGYDAYQNIWEAVVPNGFIIAFPKTEGGILPSHSEYGKDLAYVVDAIHNLGTVSSSILFDKVATEDAVMGHSMGGGAAFLAAGFNPNIKNIVTLAPAETNPSAISAAGTISIPSFVIAGSNDCVTPPATNQILMYNALQSDCKTLITIDGASHCQMADSNFLCSVGEVTCTPSPEITRDLQHEIINFYLINWLQAKLKGDCVAGTNFDEQIATDGRIEFQKNCQLCNSLSTANLSASENGIFPNPFLNYLSLKGDDNLISEFTLYDANAREVKKSIFKGSGTLDTANLSSGIYFYSIKANEKVIKRGKLVKN